jgi:hypothetical protein
MGSLEEAINSARRKVLLAGSDVDDYLSGSEHDPVHFERLAPAAQSARAELLDLLSHVVPETK